MKPFSRITLIFLTLFLSLIGSLAQAAVFELAVNEDANPVAPGEVLTYTLTYANTGDSSSTQTLLSFPLPNGVTFVSATGGGVLSGDQVDWNLNTLPAQQPGRQRVKVRTNDSLVNDTVLQVNAASISGQINFADFRTQATVDTLVHSVVPLKLGLELNPNPVQPNETLNTYLTVSNTSNRILTGVTLKLQYPENLRFLREGSNGANIDGGDCPSTTCDSNEQLTWTLGNLAPGAGIRVNIAPVVSRNATTGNLITFDVQVTEDGGIQVANSHTVVVQTDPVFDLAIDEDSNPVAPGEVLIYTLNYTNRSATSAKQTQLSFPLPEGVTFVSTTGGGVLNGRQVDWNLNTVPARQIGRQQVSVRVNDALITGTLLKVNTASITGQANFINFTAHATAVTRVDGVIPLKLGLELNPTPVPNKTLNTYLTVTNTSDRVLLGVNLKFRYPENLRFVREDTDGANIDGGVCPGTTCDPNEQLVWALGNLLPGAGIRVNLAPTVSRTATTGNLITFDAMVTEDNGAQVINSHTVAVQTDPVFDLAIDEDNNPVVPGEILTYTLTYANRSSTQAQLSFPLPEGVTFVSATGGGVLSGRQVNWNLGTLPGNIGGLQRVRVRVDNTNKPGTTLRINAASLKGIVNATEFSAHSTAITRVQGDIPLSLKIVLDQLPVLPNETLNTQLTVTNTSSDVLFGVSLKLRYPENLRFVREGTNGVDIDGGDCPGTTCDPDEQLIWTLGNLDPGASVSVNFAPVVSANAAGDLITFDAIVTEDNSTQTSNSTTVFVGSNFSVGAENDSDNDGIPDSVDPDDDNDGMPDTWENLHGLNPFDASDANQDADNDGDSNLQEYLAGTDPGNPADNSSEVVYIPLDTPCRIVNTNASGSPFNTTRTEQSFVAWGQTNQLNPQRDTDGSDALGACLPVTGLKPLAMAANITVAAKGSQAKGNVVTYPFGLTPPTASLVNFQANNIANSSIITLASQSNKHFTVKASLNGFNPGGSRQANVIIDALGYFYPRQALAATPPPSLSYLPLPQPCRIVNTSGVNRAFNHLDRKKQGFLAWGTSLALDGQRDADGNQNLGACLPEGDMVPAAMMANVTVAAKGLKGIGNVVAFQHGTPVPTASLVNFTANNIANASIVSLKTDGTPHFDIEARIFRNNPGGSRQAHLVVDVQGYFYSQDELTAAAKTGLGYIPLTQPCRIVDTRGVNKPFHFQTRKTQGFIAWGTQAQLNLQRGNNGVGSCQPKDGMTPTAVMANVTVAAKRHKSRGNVVVYPTGSVIPKSSLVNFLSNNIANSSIIAVNPDNPQHFNVTADIRGTAPGGTQQADVIVDVIGYFYP